MTVSEDGRPDADAVPIGRPPRYSPEKRAALGREAWRLRDTGWGSVRKIAKMFTDRGDPCSHTLVWLLIKEAQEQSQFLDYVQPAESRAATIGRLDEILAEQLETVRRHKAALETGESGEKYKDRADVLDKAVARYITMEQLWVKVTGAAMPTRHSLEDPNGNPVTPNMALFAGLRHAVNDHEQKTRDMEENDGLDG